MKSIGKLFGLDVFTSEDDEEEEDDDFGTRAKEPISEVATKKLRKAVEGDSSDLSTKEQFELMRQLTSEDLSGEISVSNRAQKEVMKEFEIKLGFESVNIREEVRESDGKFLGELKPERLALLLKLMKEKGVKELHPNADWGIEELKETVKNQVPKEKYHKLL